MNISQNQLFNSVAVGLILLIVLVASTFLVTRGVYESKPTVQTTQSMNSADRTAATAETTAIDARTKATSTRETATSAEDTAKKSRATANSARDTADSAQRTSAAADKAAKDASNAPDRRPAGSNDGANTQTQTQTQSAGGTQKESTEAPAK